MRQRLLAWLLVLACAPALAVIETYEFDEESLRLRFKDLAEELRCPKCQNQNIADSNAPISKDLRKLLHEQLEAGASDREILDYMVARYGEFVRYRPSLSGATLVLWMAPVLLLLAGVAVALLALRGRRERQAAPQALSAEEQQQLQDLLNEAERDS